MEIAVKTADTANLKDFLCNKVKIKLFKPYDLLKESKMLH